MLLRLGRWEDAALEFSLAVRCGADRGKAAPGFLMACIMQPDLRKSDFFRQQILKPVNQYRRSGGRRPMSSSHSIRTTRNGSGP